MGQLPCLLRGQGKLAPFRGNQGHPLRGWILYKEAELAGGLIHTVTGWAQDRSLTR
jgi:hypothetical protein